MLKKTRMALQRSHRYTDVCIHVIKRMYTNLKRVETSGEGTGNGVMAKRELALLYSVQVLVLFLNF